MSTNIRKQTQQKYTGVAYQRKRRKQRGRRRGMLIAVIVGLAIVALGGIFFFNTRGSSENTARQTGTYPFQIGSPGPGEPAPDFSLASTTGSRFTLAALHGKTVLLYFQEGLTCQPCWDQLKDIQTHQQDFEKLGITQIVSITTDPLDALQQKVADEGLTIPVLSDPDLAVSGSYTANSYGMMGKSRDGHTFVLVGPDGRIRWRADYGGAPKYIMDVPVPNLLADIQAGLKRKMS